MTLKLGGVILGAALLALGCGDGAQGGKNSWKAVFLTSGQVYYGKIAHARGQFYKLQDVYYIRVNPQQEDKTKPPDLTLVKLGNEIHGPEDAIYLNRDHILYIEDLKEDGQVVKAIADAKTAGTTPAMAGQPPAPPATDAGNPAQPGGGGSTRSASSAEGDQAEQFKQFQKFLEAQKQQASGPAKKDKGETR
jgi:hypothetical protein